MSDETIDGLKETLTKKEEFIRYLEKRLDEITNRNFELTMRDTQVFAILQVRGVITKQEWDVISKRRKDDTDCDRTGRAKGRPMKAVEQIDGESPLLP